MRDYRKIIAKIKSANSNGTAFLISDKYAITAAHVIDEGDENDVKLTFYNLPKKVIRKGKALNLQKSLDENIDAVLIELEESFTFLPTVIPFICSDELPERIRWTSYAYPSVKQHGEPIRGYINNTITTENEAKWDIDLFCDNQLLSYKGASGSPLIINNKIVGIIIEETNNTLTAISTKKMLSFLQDNNISIINEIINFSYPQELDLINENWFSNHIERALNHAKPRYTPQLSVEVPLNKYFAAFSQSDIIFHYFDSLIDKLNETIKNWKTSVDNLDDWNGKADFPDAAKETSKSILDKMMILETSIDNILTEENPDVTFLLDYIDILINENECNERVLIDDFEEKHGKGNHLNKNYLQFLHEYQMSFPERHIEHSQENFKIFTELKETLTSPIIKAFHSSQILITGAWGTGKTHCICDFLDTWNKSGGYGILLFGEQFREGDVWTHIKNKLDIPITTSTEHLLAKLNNIAAETGKPLLFFIDALNETKQTDFWIDNLKNLLFDFNNYSNIKLAISCRTSYISKTIKEDVQHELLSVEHNGFTNIEYEASLEFFDFYNIEKPSFPIMNSEFSNPLFLRLFCETVEGGNSNTYKDFLSITKLVEAFLIRKNKEISNKHVEILEREYLVHKILITLAFKAFELEAGDLLWSEAVNIIQEIVSDRTLSRKLFDELLQENLIREDVNENNEDIILFSFERLYEHLVVEKLLDGFDNVEDVRNEFDINGKFKWLIQDETSVGKYNGIIEAFTIYVAEKFVVELVEITDYNNLIIKPTLRGMVWRSNEAFFYSSQTIVNRSLRSSELVEDGWLTLIQLSTRTNCLLNSEFLYRILEPVSLPERDLTWSSVLFNKYREEQSITRVVNSAITYELNNLHEDTAKLWAETLLWFCSSNDRRLRDYSTRALTNIIEKTPSIALTLFDRFFAINDDYIFERLTLAIYGAFVRNPIAEVIVQLIRDFLNVYAKKAQFPTNVLIRDNLRGVAELALSLAILPEDISIEHFRPPYESQWPLEIPSNDFIEQYKESYHELPKLYQSCFNDDFEKYTLSHIENYCKLDYGKSIETVDGFSKYDFQKWIFKNVLDLGYSEQFENDGYLVYHYGGGRAKPKWVERVGKKYQLISFHRLLGFIKDNLKVERNYFEIENPVTPPFQGLSQRDLDPTFGKITQQDYREKKWNNLFDYDFSNYFAKPDEWLDLSDLPTPSDLIQKNNNGEHWFVLSNHYSQKHYLSQDKSSFNDEYVNLYVAVRCYFVKKSDFLGTWSQLGETHIWDNYSPHENGIYEGFIGEYPWGTSFVNMFNEYSSVRNLSGVNGDLIKTFHEQTVEYEFDVSLDDEINYGRYVPSEIFFEKCELKWDKKAGFVDASNNLCFFDPHVENGGSSMLLGNKDFLENFCNQNELSMIWTIHSEKMIVRKEPKSNLSTIHYALYGYNGEYIMNEYKTSKR